MKFYCSNFIKIRIKYFKRLVHKGIGGKFFDFLENSKKLSMGKGERSWFKIGGPVYRGEFFEFIKNKTTYGEEREEDA